MSGLWQFLVVTAMVPAAVLVDYTIARIQLATQTRANHRALQSLRAIAAARCPRCGCQVHAGHEADGTECLELQAERRVRSEARAAEWA